MFMQELENRLVENPNSFDEDSKLIVQRYVNEGKVEYLSQQDGKKQVRF